MTECQVCGKPIDQPARGYRKNCSDACRQERANRNRRDRGTTLLTLWLDRDTRRRIRSKAGPGKRSVPRFVRKAIETALRGGS